MTRKNKNRRRGTLPQPVRKPLARFALLLAFCIMAVAGVLLAVLIKNQKAAGTRGSLPDVVPCVQRVQSLGDLLKMPREQLAEVDIAEMNLHCAGGLPGGEKLDIGRCLATLDEWAGRVKSVTERYLYRANDPRWAEHYKHSQAWLRIEFLAQVLQEDCGVHYNMERLRNIDFKNSKDLFIHGMIDDPNGGTWGGGGRYPYSPMVVSFHAPAARPFARHGRPHGAAPTAARLIGDSGRRTPFPPQRGVGM